MESFDLQPDKGQVFRGEECLDLRQRHSPLGDVEQKIAAGTGAEEIPRLRDVRPIRRLFQHHQVLAASANVLHGRLVAALRDEAARSHDMLAGDFAIEPDAQQPLRPQQLYEHAPARERIGEVMQHSDGPIRSKVRAIASRRKMSAWPYSILARPSARVFRRA